MLDTKQTHYLFFFCYHDVHLVFGAHRLKRASKHCHSHSARDVDQCFAFCVCVCVSRCSICSLSQCICSRRTTQCARGDRQSEVFACVCVYYNPSHVLPIQINGSGRIEMRDTTPSNGGRNDGAQTHGRNVLFGIRVVRFRCFAFRWRLSFV